MCIDGVIILKEYIPHLSAGDLSSSGYGHWQLSSFGFSLQGNSRAFFGHQSSFVSLWTWDLALLTFLSSQFMSFCKTQEALHFWRYVCSSSVILQPVLMFPGLIPKGGFACVKDVEIEKVWNFSFFIVFYLIQFNLSGYFNWRHSLRESWSSCRVVVSFKL